MLLSLVISLILAIAVFASAAGGGAGAALGAATGQVGKPYAFGTDGPGTFSCTGLVRHALRAAGVDPAAPWDHMAYLSVYPTRANPEPGDVVVYGDGVAMYAGDGKVVMANEVDGVVGIYGMNEVGVPLGFANPYGGSKDTTDPVVTGDPTISGATNPTIAGENDPMMGGAIDSTITGAPAAPIDQTALDPAAGDPTMPVEPLPDTMATDPAALEPQPMADPTMLAGAPTDAPPPSDAPAGL